MNNKSYEFDWCISAGGHVSGLERGVETAIYPAEAFNGLQTFANAAKDRLERNATAYNQYADAVMDNMDGATRAAYADSLRRGADYSKAIAQTIDTDFFGSGFSGEKDKTSGFPNRSSTTLAWSRKSIEELLKMLGFDQTTGTFELTEDVWENIQYLLDLPYESMTDEMFLALSMILVNSVLTEK